MNAPAVDLRPVAEADHARLLAWRNDPDVARWMYSDHVITADEHDRWCASALVDPRRRYWIIEADGLPVGLANVVDISEADRRCAWAYYLADPSTRGKGIGAYVEYCILEHVFGPMGLNKLWCEVLIENEGVWRLHESFGFQREALYRAHVWKAGQPRDVVGLGLLAADWARQRPVSAERLTSKGFDLSGPLPPY